MSGFLVSRRTVKQVLLQGLLLAGIASAAAAVALLPAPPDAPQAMIGFAIVVSSVAIWATNALPTLAAGLLFFALAFAAQVAPPLALLSGFWSNAAGLVIGGFVIGAAAERSGLGRYIARRLMQHLLSSYPRSILGILAGTGALSFVLPSTMGRLSITLPIVMAVAKEAGYAPGSNGYIGLITTAVAGNFMTSYAILPSNLTNVIALGAVESAHGLQIHYVEYLLLCGPVLGLAKALLFWLATIVLLPAPPPQMATGPAEPVLLSGAAKRLGIVLVLTILLWATDFLHGIKPGAVAIGAALLCLLPPVALANLRESFDLTKLTAILFLAVVLGVATILTSSGAGGVTAKFIGDLVSLEGRSASFGFALVSFLSAFISIPATVVGSIAIVNPMMGSIATSTGLSIKAGFIAEMTGLQMIFFPFQTVPIMVGLMMGRVEAKSVLRLLVPLALVSLAVILPLQILWLRRVGALP
jgi:di/tricarboxylate transporter